MVRRARAGIVAVALALPVAACQLLVGIGDDNFTYVADAPAAETSNDAGDAGSPDLCAHATTLSAPDTTDGPDGPMFVFALNGGSATGRNDAGAIAGFDLDGVCTCDPRDLSERRGQPSCVPPVGAIRTGGCDDDAGIDNAAAGIFDQLLAFSDSGVLISDLDQTLYDAVTCGKQTVLVALQKYNGLANDPSVFVSVMPSDGIRDAHAAGDPASALCMFNGTPFPGQPYPAKRDGTDRWSVLPGYVNAAGFPARTPAQGWVKDFHLTFDLRAESAAQGSQLVSFIFGTKFVAVASSVFQARLVPLDENGKELAIDAQGKIVAPGGKATSFALADGTLTGRASASDVLSAVGSFRVGAVHADGGDLCASALYPLLKETVCSAADVMDLPTRDFAGDPCNALSLVLQFDAAPAAFGKVHEPERDGGGCGVDWRDSCPADSGAGR